MSEHLMVTWLRAQLDEIEAVAQAAADQESATRWPAISVSACIAREQTAAHIAAHDPASVLARVETERAILDEHEPVPRGLELHNLGPACGSCGYIDAYPVTYPCATVRLLVSGHRHALGFDPTWTETV